MLLQFSLIVTEGRGEKELSGLKIPQAEKLSLGERWEMIGCGITSLEIVCWSK
jgi:hypothetical protein